MKKLWTAINVFAIVFYLGVIACSSRKSVPVIGKEFNPQNARVVNGEKIYMANCQKCHPGGEGGLAPALNSNPAPGFVKRFQMRHGLGVMPGFKKETITQSDLRDISNYLRAWKHYE